jgi:hypothetical protein
VGSGGEAAQILKLKSIRKWIILTRVRPLYPQQRNTVTIKYVVGWPPTQVWAFWGRKNLLFK